MNAVPDVFSPAKLGPITLRNRTIKAATFEGRTPYALVTDDLIAFHRAMAAGGVGMTTVAYCAVSPGGRTDGKQVWMRPDAVPGLRRLAEAVHAEGAAITSLMSSRSACLANLIAIGLKNRTGASAVALLDRASATGPACPIWALTAAPSAWTAAVRRCRPGTASGRIQTCLPSVRPPGLTAQ